MVRMQLLPSVLTTLSMLGAVALLACGDTPSDGSASGGSGGDTTVDSGMGGNDTTANPDGDTTSDVDGTTNGVADADSGTDAASDATTDQPAETTDSGTTGSTSPIDPDGALFVRDDGMNSNDGTPEEPLRTIQWAIAQAELSPDIERIYVAEGNYTTDFVGNDRIVVSDGLALYGGYRSDWSERDPLEYVTEIREVPSVAQDYWVVLFPPDVGSETVFDGFAIVLDPDTQDFQLGIVAQGDAQVSGNRIEGHAPGDTGRAYGIVVEGGSPTIIGNRIDLSATAAIGVMVGASPLFNEIPPQGTTGAAVHNNVIHVQSAGDLSTNPAQASGIVLADTDGVIAHNSIHAEADRAISIISVTAATVTNNILSSSVCVRNSSGFTGVFVSNVFDCRTALSEGGAFGENLLDLEAEFRGSMDNVSVLGVFDALPSLELDANDECLVTAGGSLLADVDVDVDGVQRTDPVSLGAYEWDDACQ